MRAEAIVNCVPELQRERAEEFFPPDPGRPTEEIEPEPIRCPYCHKLSSDSSVLLDGIDIKICPFCHRAIE